MCKTTPTTSWPIETGPSGGCATRITCASTSCSAPSTLCLPTATVPLGAKQRYFLIIHQVSELWVSQILVHLELALESARLTDFDRAIDRLTRANAMLELTVTTQSALQHLGVDDFQQFRPRLRE
jgi:hypothetical protein